MKTPSVRDLKANENFTAIFRVQSKEARQKRTGESYLSMMIADRTGEIDAKMWDGVAEVIETFDRDDFIKVRGLMQIYNNRPQVTIYKLRRAEPHEFELADFFPASHRDPAEMWLELRAAVAAVKNDCIRALLDLFLDDPEIAARYKIAPAAKTIHHAFRSGLLEHVLSLVNLAKVVVPHYAERYSVDYDLVIAGAVLHDIGKIHELSYDGSFSYSAEGQLLGHIAIAIRMLSEKVAKIPAFPPELRNLIEHLILSHHGQLEYGSPKVPIFPEALLLHYLDDLDSKMECMRTLAEADPQTEGCFTRYSPSMERVALRKSRYLTPESNAPSVSSDHRIALDDWGDKPKQNSKPAPASNSMFGDKLQQALHIERK